MKFIFVENFPDDYISKVSLTLMFPCFLYITHY